MNDIKVSLIAFPGAPKKIFEKGEKIIKSKFANTNIIFDQADPDAIFILTGGSEKQAQNLLKNKKRILLLAITSDNSYAAATEIKSYCNQQNIDSVLYNIDHEPDIQQKVDFYNQSIQALKAISQYKMGLIGNVSEWLINSDIDSNLLKNKLGIEIEQVAWSEYPEYTSFPVNKEFMDHFKTDDFQLEDSSRVYNLLQHIQKDKKLDAITVECFPLVREHAVTACLALSKFNTNGSPAGCEGDITSITGKIVTKELTGIVPWMANLASIQDNMVFLAHCTIATNLVSDYTIKTHFETNQGTAVQGKFKAENVTLFRLNNDLTKAFISYGNIVERPEKDDACRTQISIEVPSNDILKLKENPLGNHHLIIPGDYRNLLTYFCGLSKLEIV